MYGYVDTADGDDGKQVCSGGTWPTKASDSSLLGHQEDDDDDMGDLAKSDNAELVRAKARAQVRYAVAT